MNRLRRIEYHQILPIVLMVLSVAAGIVGVTGTPDWLRPLLVIPFLFIAPGLAYVRLLPLEDGVTLVTMAVALSLALDSIVAVALLYAGAWQAETILLILVGITMIGCVLQYRRPAEQEALQ